MLNAECLMLNEKTPREADSDRRAAGSRWISFTTEFHDLQKKPLDYCRLLRGGNLCNLCDLWFRKIKNSCLFVRIRGSIIQHSAFSIQH